MLKGLRFVYLMLALAAIVALAGCTAPAGEAGTTLSGKDVFDPDAFSMATYAVLAGENETGLLTVLAYPGEKDGDRLSSVIVTANASSRMDAWLDRSHRGINNATMTLVDGEGLQTVTMPEALNMTTIDEAWNTPGSTYAYQGKDSVTVPAGSYDNCSIYYGKKRIQYLDSYLDIEVLYYMHPDSPVPVFYMVRSSDGVVAYALRSAYGPDDVDSTPERAVQCYFDRIGSGEFTKAARLLVTQSGSTLQSLDRASVAGMAENMSRTYGTAGEKMAVQYVVVDAVTPADPAGGHERADVHWTSVHVSRAPGQVYYIDGTFGMVDDGGWKIIV